MIQIIPLSRILAAVNPIDFRKGIDGLAGVCLNKLAQDPLTGTIFLFRNHANNAIKVLVYDGQGFLSCTKDFLKGNLVGGQQVLKLRSKLIVENFKR